MGGNADQQDLDDREIQNQFTVEIKIRTTREWEQTSNHVVDQVVLKNILFVLEDRFIEIVVALPVFAQQTAFRTAEPAGWTD